MKSKHIYILGPGAIGCLWASALYQVQTNCHLIVRDKQSLTRLNQQGIKFDSLISTEQALHFFPEGSTANTLNSQHTIKILLVTTKATQTLSALISIQQHISKQTILILLQNGMGIQQTIAKLFPQNVILVAVTTEGAYASKPFQLTHAGSGITSIGLYALNQTNNSCAATNKKEIVTHAVRALNNPWLPIAIDTDITQAMWKKLSINAAINAYTVIYNCLNGDLLNIPDALVRIENCCNEINKLTEKIHGAPLTYNLFEDVKNVLQKTAHNQSSMLQDIRAGKQTEIDYINGYLVNLAETHDISCPENRAVWQAIKHNHY